MKTLTTIKAWFLICTIIVVSSVTTEHTSSHHDVSHHGDSTPKKNHQNTIVPFGIQIPEHMLSTQNVACISTDLNIFEIMNKAQESCNGTDMRCTFYHFMNHGYQNIGTLDIDKELFDDLLMKFDNWLLTAENIEKGDVPLDGKTKEDSSLDTASINVNGSYSNEGQIKNSTNVSKIERLYTNEGVHIDNVDHNTNEFDNDNIVNAHHIKHFDEKHHRNHHHKWKNENHIELVPEYNNDHRYFEVFLPKDRETGKPRTIYVEVDRDKNEFVLLDEEIDKKLNGMKPIKIELDELSEIADTVFNNVAKSSNKKHHVYSDLNDDERVMISDVNTYSAVNEDTTNLDIDVGESTQNISNSSICNINANQQLMPDNTTGNVMRIVNGSKNLVVPNKYINQAQFCLESQIDNTTDEIPNDLFELLESSNETDIHQTGFYEETSLDTIEYNEKHTNIDLDLDNIECSLENFDIPCDDNSTENYELPTEYDNVTFYDDSYLQLEENNDTVIDIELDDTHEFTSSETIHLNEPIFQAEQLVQENKLKSPSITTYPIVENSEHSGSQLVIPSENRQGHTDLQEHSPKPSTPISPHTTIPILGTNLAKVLETDSNLKSSFPAYATLDLPAVASQNPSLCSDFAHPSISSYNSPLDSDFGHQTTRPIISTIFPTPPVECVVKLNKGSQYSPLNFGFSWLPSYLRIEELRLPCAVNSSPQESIMQLPDLKNKQLTDSICPEPSSFDYTIPVEDPRLFQTVPPLSVYIQKPSSPTEPYHLEADTPMLPKPVLPSKLDLPKSNTDLDGISTTYQLSETPISVMPDSLINAVNSPCPMQPIPLYLQPTKPNQDLGYIKYSPFDNNSKETKFPCSPCKNRHPYTTTPYFLNPNLKPQYLEPLMPVAPSQPASKIPMLDSLSLSSDQSNPCLNGDYSIATKPIPLLPFAPSTPFSPLSPLLIGPGFVPNTSPCQNVWNNIQHLPCTIFPNQNIKNYPPVNNYSTLSAVLQQNHILNPLKIVPLSTLEQPCPIKNILEMTPPSYTSFLPPVQMDLNPSLALERDLQSLSLKYGIPPSKILNALDTEISDAHSKTCSPTFEVPYANLVHDSSLINKLIFSKTNAVLVDDNRSSYEESLLESDLTNLVPLDSSLIGPHLEIESSLMVDANDSQSNTVLSESTVPPSLNSSFENPPTKLIHESSLIGPHLSTLSSSNFLLSDENHIHTNTNEVLLSKSDSSTLIPLDSSLIGPNLEMGSRPIVLDSYNSQGDIITSYTEVPITISSQIKPKVKIQNQPTNLQDSSLIGSQIPPLSPVKPLFTNEIQTTNDMIPLETDLNDLTILDSPLLHSQEDFVNELQQSEILQHDKTAVTLCATTASRELHKPSEYLPTNLLEEELLFESDPSRLIPLDFSLIGPELKLENSPIIVNAVEDKTVPAISLDSLQNTDTKVEELESIILPSSLLLNKLVKADSNLNIITQETKLNDKLDKLSLNTNVELPLTDISLIPYKETDFEIDEPIFELPSLIDDINIPLLTKDSSPLKQKSKSSDMAHVVDSETLLNSSFTGTTMLHKLEKPEISTSIDPSIHFDSTLIGPSIQQEIDSPEISLILDSVNHLQNSLALTTINQKKKPSEILTAIDFPVPLESSLKRPTILHETSNALDSVTQFDKSLVPAIHETKESSATTPVFGSKSQLNSSLKGPSLYLETQEVSHAFDSKDLLDNSLIGPHLSTVPFSSDKIQMINEELQPESSLANLVPLDSSFVGPHVDFESDVEQSEILRHQNPESSLTSVINPYVFEPTELPCDLAEGLPPLEPSTLPSIGTYDQQELLSKFTNAITKFQPVPSELKPCDKLLSSIAKIASDNSYVLPSCKDLQKLTLNPFRNTPMYIQEEIASEFSPITMTSPAQELSPVRPIVPCLESNYYFPTPKTLAELPIYAQEVPQIPFMPSSPFVQMKPKINRNWLAPQTLNIQNNLPASPTPSISNALIPLTSEDFKPLLYSATHNKLYPQLSIPNVYTPGDAVALPSEWTTSSYILPLHKYIPLLSKHNSQVLPSNLQSTISNSKYNPIVVDDVMSLLDENNRQLLKDMSILPFSQSSFATTMPVIEKGEIVSQALDTLPIPNSDFIQTRPLLPISFTNPLVPLLLSKPCVESPIILPSSSSDTMLQMPTASNGLNSVPSQSPLEYFTQISPICPTTLSNTFTNPILPIHASPVSFAKPISTPSTSLPINVPYDTHGPLIPLPLSINPYTARPLTPNFSSPLMPLNITPLSDYSHAPTVAHNRPMLSEIPYKPSQTYSNPYVPIHASPFVTSPGSPNIMTRLPPAMTSPISPVFYEPLSTSNFSPLPKSLTNIRLPAYSGPLAPISLSKLAPTPTGLLSPSYLSPYIPAYSYSSLPVPINTQIRPSNLLKPAYVTPISPVSSSFSSYNTPLSLNPIITTPDLKSRLLNTLPITNAVNPFLNTNQRLPINTKTLPIQSYSTHVTKSSPLSNLQIKQNIPCIDDKESNLLNSPSTEGLPSYDVIKESTCTHSNDKDDQFYEEANFKYPLESLSYTLASAEITEALPNEDSIKQEELTPSAPVNNRASEPSLQTKLYQYLRHTPYAPLQGKPFLKPRSAPQILPPPSFTDSIPENIFDNIRPVQSSSPLKYPVSLLKPLTAFTSATNFPITAPSLAGLCIDTSLSPYNKLPMNETLESLSSFPYYSAPSQDMSSPPIDPRELRNIVTPQVTPAFSQIATNEAFVPASWPIISLKSQPPISPYILDNFIQFPSTHNEPKSKTFISQGSLVKPLPISSYKQYAAPIISHSSPLQKPITFQYITPLTVPQTLKKIKPILSPQYYSSSASPAQTPLQDSLPLNKAPIDYQPYIQQPTTLTANNILQSPPTTSSYTVLPSVNMVEPVSTELNRPQPLLTPQYSVAVSSLPVSKSTPIITHSKIPYSRISSHIPMQALTNHIIPSSLFMSSDTDFQTPTNKLSPLHNISRKSYPSPSLIEPATVSFYYTPSRPLDTTANPQNILKLKSPLPSFQYTRPLSSSPYLTQPTNSYQTQPLSNVQYTTKPHSKLSPVPVQYASPSLSPLYTSLPLETVPTQLINNNHCIQYSLPSAPVYDSPKNSSPSVRNPFINPDFKPFTEAPSYPIPKNIISSSILTPPESIRLTNQERLDISQEPKNVYTSPITSSAPLYSSSLIKPSVKTLPQKSRQYKPHIIPSKSQYVSQSPIDVPQLLPFTSPFLKIPLLNPFLTTSQNNVPLLPMHFTNTNTAFPEAFPKEAIPSVTSPDIALSNYLPPDSSNHKCSGLYNSMVTEIPEIVKPINPSSTTSNILLKPPFKKHFKSPVNTLKNMPVYSNYDILEPSPKLPIRVNIINTAKPVEVSAISTSESSPLPIDSLNSCPVFTSKYLSTPQPSKTLPSFKYIPAKPPFSKALLIPEEAELIDTTDIIPLSQINSEPLIADYSPNDRKVSKPNMPSNIPELDILKLLPYTSLIKTEFPSSTYKQLPSISQYNNKISQLSPVYITPQEYKDLTQGLSPTQASLSSSSTVLSSTNIGPQLVTSPLTGGPSPQITFYTRPMSTTTDNWLQSENLLEVKPEKESVLAYLDKYRPANKITPPGENNYPYEPKSTISEVFPQVDSVNPLLKSKERYTTYIEDLKSNEYNEYDPESDNVSIDENQSKSLPEIIKGLSVPNYNKIVQRPQRLSKMKNFYANNYIGYNTIPLSSPTNSKSPSATTSPEILKDFTNIPTTYFESVPKLDTSSLRPSICYPKIADSPENVPITNLYPQNYLNPCLKFSSQKKSPLNTIDVADTYEMTSNSYSLYNNIEDIKYSGYNLGTNTRMSNPSVITYSSPISDVKRSKVHQTLSLPNSDGPTKISEPLIPQYQTQKNMTTPLQTKLSLNTLPENLKFKEYNLTEVIPINIYSINEDNELQTSLINYINKKEDIKNNLLNNNAEITIPIGYIAITKKEPCNASTIETNNPSIGLKVWKSNVKIAEAELKLKFKDLSVNNFMPLVNNFDKYDMEEIRKIVKNYIDEKYGNHIEINEPYTIDNKYTVIKDFDHNAVDNKYNLLWPTNYV